MRSALHTYISLRKRKEVECIVPFRIGLSVTGQFQRIVSVYLTRKKAKIKFRVHFLVHFHLYLSLQFKHEIQSSFKGKELHLHDHLNLCIAHILCL